jgi:GH25 family lysozyme M1 (1,4-beta-N-acetylmuramidase)
MTSTRLPTEPGVAADPPQVAISSRGAPARPRRTGVASRPFRVLTANIQSVPEGVLTTEQALIDLTRNATDGDIVLLQEIAFRYQALVEDAFPAPQWEVYYGQRDNAQPIAFRRDLFEKVSGDVVLLHEARAGLHRRRYITHLQLRHRAHGCDFHVTNLHLVAGAFHNPGQRHEALRLEEWRAGIAKHIAMVESLVAGGLPVIGGGDYNRQLRRHRSMGTAIAGRPVTYAVDGGAIDLLWCVDGDRARWEVSSRRVYPGRDSKNPVRHSDHPARAVSVTLAAPRSSKKANGPPLPTQPNARSAAGETSGPTDPRGATRRPRPARHRRRAHGQGTTANTRERLPGPFELTTFGDGTPKKVDWKTRAALEEVERRLDYRLTVVQGSYNAGTVSASAGTHDGGGVVDLLAWDWKQKVRVLRATGFAAWYRPTVKGLWGEHIHAVLIDHGRLSPSAARQVGAYRAGRDGLKSNRADPFWRPDPIPVFDYRRATRSAPPSAKARSNGAAKAKRSDPPGGPAFPPRRTLDGVDTSHHQSGRIDLKAARAAGLRWWYVKATEGTTFTDRSYQSRVRQARQEGIPVGAYHFARPDRGDAAEEARFFLSRADIRAGDMLPMLDLESTEGLSESALTSWTGTWVRTVCRELARKRLIGKPIIYTPFNLGNGFGCLLWVARYSNDYRAPVIPRPWRRAVIWQHSDGRFGPIRDVPGFGAVDVNALHPDVPLSALRLRSAKERSEVTRRSRTRRPPAHPPGGDRPDVQELRGRLRAVADSVDALLDSLPER